MRACLGGKGNVVGWRWSRAGDAGAAGGLRGCPELLGKGAGGGGWGQVPAASQGKGFGLGGCVGRSPGGIQTLPCVRSVPHLSSPPPVPNRTQNCTGGSLPPPKIGHLNSKLFLNEIAKKEKQLRKLLEGG